MLSLLSAPAFHTLMCRVRQRGVQLKATCWRLAFLATWAGGSWPSCACGAISITTLLYAAFFVLLPSDVVRILLSSILWLPSPPSTISTFACVCMHVTKRSNGWAMGTGWEGLKVGIQVKRRCPCNVPLIWNR